MSETSQPTEAHGQAMQAASDIHILIVEDSPTQMARLRYALEQRGYRVSAARNGREALVSMARDKPTVVVTDIVMPEMDGYELCRRIKANAQTSAVPVILLTALSDPRDILRALACGAENFVTKPYKNEVLFDRLDRSILLSQESERTARASQSPTISFDGETYPLPTDVRQVTTLLFSTYEEAVERRTDVERINNELKQAQSELKTLNERLEEKVRERTAEIEASEANYRRLLETNISALVLVNPDRVVQYANGAAYEMLGPEHGGRVGATFDLPLSTGTTVEHPLTRPSGGDRILEIRAEKTIWEGRPVDFVLLIDITERRRTEEIRHRT